MGNGQWAMGDGQWAMGNGQIGPLAVTTILPPGLTIYSRGKFHWKFNSKFAFNLYM